jgi:hypothetical protein
MKKKREVHEGIINLVHQKSSVDPMAKVSGNFILFVLLIFARSQSVSQLDLQY